MNNNHLIGIGGLALMAVLAGFSSISSSTRGTITRTGVSIGRTSARTGASTDISTATSINASISLQALEKQLPAAAGDNISVLLYPAKRTPDTQKNDFELIVFILDGKGQEIPMNGSPGEDVFRKESANYISYLHHRAIPQEKVPQTYQLTLSSNRISLYSALNIHITLPPAADHNIAWLTGSRRLHPTPADSLHPRQTIDSVPVGKCPPCTGTGFLLTTKHISWIQSLIGKEYRKP